MNNNRLFVSVIQVDKGSFGKDFSPTDLMDSDPERKLYTRKAVRNIAKMICKENEPRIAQNLENVARKLPSNRVYTICGEKFNDFSNSMYILE